MSYKSLVLLSGGLDSAVTLALAVEKKENPLAVTFDYGQKAAVREIKASRGLTKFYRVAHRVIKIDWLKKISGSALLDSKTKIPQKSMAVKDSLKVWVPNRNGLFINIAATLAEALGIPVVYAGFNREEAGNFPDNSAGFIKAVNSCLKFSTLNRVRLKSFLIKLNKTGILKKAIQLKIPLKLIWVCYQSGLDFCGQCESCLRFKRAVKNLKLKSNENKIF